jgi:hypothetical protein
MSTLNTPDIGSKYSFSVRSRTKAHAQPLHKSLLPKNKHLGGKKVSKSPKKRTKFPQISKRARKMNQMMNAKRPIVVGRPRRRAEHQFKESTKLFRRQVYEAARRNHSIDIDMILPSITTRKTSKKTRRFVNYKSTATQKSLENLMNISQLGDTKASAILENSKEQSISAALMKEEDGDGAIDKSKYQYLSDAKGFSIDQLKNDKEDSFINTTKA